MQLIVASPPSRVIVPPFALNVGEPEINKLPAIVIVPEDAVNVPPLIDNSPLKSAPDVGRLKLPENNDVLVLDTNDE